MPDPSSPSLKQLNDRRRRAVELRLAFRELKLNVPLSPSDLALPRLPGVVEEPLGR